MILYVHIPFCHRICPYCSFYKHTPGDTDIQAFIRAILHEAKETASSSSLPPIDTLYLGGGTPSMLSPKHLTELFEGFHRTLPLENTHITMEANPATFGPNKAALFKELGVNRTSLGIQSFNDHVLKTLGREHNPEQAAESVRILRDAGMDEINIDLMFSIPGLSNADWQHSLDTAVALKPDHISAYNLTYEEDTEFIEKLTQGDYAQSEDTNAVQFQQAHDTLTAAGFLHYETSNYAQPGMESRHNQSYWQGIDYLGLGPSAVATVGDRRWRNLPDTAGYIHAINTVGHAKREEEIIDAEAYRIERIALLLRTTEGLPDHYLEGSPEGEVDTLIENELAEIKEGKLRLINTGILLVDAIAEKLV
ncbi:radical SAM family heme chaperone HemW [Verrucomicrobiaceae bacterium R5-34]|nr:radical SAM family heme chaperone HemW [Verrucomicrobiaceae bacterium R5-34]